mmetsp:Transcript_1709/g.4596  ORF Transcript_1709/g.4596 Transcript_1709/m.4596 type:complete len:201 (+) Transcript_1709:143-745(+)
MSSDSECASLDSTDLVSADHPAHDWNDPEFDAHFGWEHKTAGDPYTNRGRTEVAWKVLIAHGFRRKVGGKGKDVFHGKVPSPCFEACARDPCDHEFLESLLEDSLPALAKSIRSSLPMDELSEEQIQELNEMDDIVLIRDALSTDGLPYGMHSYYYSFCYGGLVQSHCTWHCRICKKMSRVERLALQRMQQMPVRNFYSL